MGTLEGKIAIVTGAASGIGECVAHTLAGRGASVVVADRNEEGAHAVADVINKEGGRAEPYAVDISVEAQVAALMEHAAGRFGGIDILHNNAADTREEVIGRDSVIGDMDVGVWDQTMAVNLRGTMLGCKHVVAHLLARGGGAVVNTTSDSGLSGDLTRSAYGASKAGINAITVYMATQYGMQGVRCNAVSPGLVMTPAADRNLTEEARQIFSLSHLSPRLCQPQDIANAVAFLASDEAGFVNGQILQVDGGLLAHMPTHAQFIAAASS